MQLEYGRGMDDEHLAEIFDGLGPISIKRLFGGKGIYHQGVIVAIVADGELLLKADAQSSPEFEAKGSQQWKYTGSRRAKEIAMPYWSVPDGALDDPDEITIWVRKAYEAGLRAAK